MINPGMSGAFQPIPSFITPGKLDLFQELRDNNHERGGGGGRQNAPAQGKARQGWHIGPSNKHRRADEEVGAPFVAGATGSPLYNSPYKCETAPCTKTVTRLR